MLPFTLSLLRKSQELVNLGYKSAAQPSEWLVSCKELHWCIVTWMKVNIYFILLRGRLMAVWSCGEQAVISSTVSNYISTLGRWVGDVYSTPLCACTHTHDTTIKSLNKQLQKIFIMWSKCRFLHTFQFLWWSGGPLEDAGHNAGMQLMSSGDACPYLPVAVSSFRCGVLQLADEILQWNYR